MSSNLQNLSTYDPFQDTGDTDIVALEQSIHIRVQQRNGRKTLTTVQGLPQQLDQRKILKAFKKDFACNGNIVQDEEMGEVIQLQGDHRHKVQQFLVEQQIATADKIKVHGF